MSIRPKSRAGRITRKTSDGNADKQGLQNPKHGKHASHVRDGWLTVPDFEVAISLGLKIPKMQF
jgi:hypothetical protein